MRQYTEDPEELQNIAEMEALAQQQDNRSGCLKTIFDSLLATSLILICGAIFLIVSVTLFINNQNIMCLGTPLSNRDSVIDKAEFDLPTSARDIAYDMRARGNIIRGSCTLLIRFDMPAVDQNQLLDTLLVTDLSDGDVLRETTIEDLGAWSTFDINAPHLAGEVDLNQGQQTQSVFIDQSNPDLWTVYFVAFRRWPT